MSKHTFVKKLHLVQDHVSSLKVYTVSLETEEYSEQGTYYQETLFNLDVTEIRNRKRE